MNYTITNDFSQVSKLTEALHSFCEESQLDDRLSGQLELILVEAINNVIEHAYTEGEEHSIYTSFKDNDSEIVMTITDSGNPVPSFVINNTGDMPDPEGLPDGGWGLALIQSLADRIERYNEDGNNIFVLGKNKILADV